MALAFLVARAVDATAFGAFSVAFLIFGLFIGLERSLVGEPMSIRFSHAQGQDRRHAVDAAVATTIAVTLAGAALLALAGVGVRGTLGPTLLALAVVLPGLVLQDSCRMIFFAQSKPQHAVINDLVWALPQFGAMAVMYVNDVSEAWPYVLAWGISAAVAASVGLRQLRSRPAFKNVAWWIRSQIDVTGYLLMEYVIGAASAQGSILLVGAVASLQDVGSLRAAQTLLGPLGIVSAAIMTFLLPEVSRRAQLPERTKLKIAVSVSSAIVVGSLVYTVMLLILPDSLGTAALGDTWTGASAVILPMSLASAAAGASLGPAIVIYAMGQARKTFRLHLFEAPLIILCMATGVHIGGTPGAAWGMATSMTMMIPLWFWQLHALLRGQKSDVVGGSPRAVEAQPERDVHL